jgi:hypothetical protein
MAEAQTRVPSSAYSRAECSNSSRRTMMPLRSIRVNDLVQVPLQSTGGCTQSTLVTTATHLKIFLINEEYQNHAMLQGAHDSTFCYESTQRTSLSCRRSQTRRLSHSRPRCKPNQCDPSAQPCTSVCSGPTPCTRHRQTLTSLFIQSTVRDA